MHPVGAGMHAVYIAHDSVTLSLTSQDQEEDKDVRTRVPYLVSSIHHCYCHSPTKGCSQQDTSNKASEGSTCTHTGAVTSYVRRRREVFSSEVIISLVNRLSLCTV